MKYFVDTSALIALADRTDQYHSRATQFVRHLTTEPQFHTSNYILNEMITRLRFTVGVNTALEFAISMKGSHLYTIHTVDHKIEELALTVLKKYADHPLSFTDCTTMVLMDRLGMSQIFAFDDDFRKVGYQLAPDLFK